MQNRKRSTYRKLQLTNIAMAAAAGLTALFLEQKPAHATPYSWSNTSGGLWSVPTNWAGGVAPASDFNNQIYFNTSGSSYTTIVDTVPSDGPFNLNSLNFNLGASDTVTFSQNNQTVDTLNFGPDANNDVPQLSVTSGSTNIINLINGSTGMVISNSGPGNLTLNDQNFGQNETITNFGSGSVVLSDLVAYNGNVSSNVTTNVVNFSNIGGINGGTGTFSIGNLGEGVSGPINILAGPVTFAGSTGGNLFGNYAILNVSAGASFNFASNGETMGGIEGSGNIIQGTAGITCTLAGDRTFNGVISGSGAFTQNASGSTLFMGGNNLYTGGTGITGGGQIVLTAANVIPPASLVTVTQGTLNIGGFNQSFGGLVGGNQSGTLPLGAATLTLTSSSGTHNWLSPITGAGSVVIQGNATQAFLGSNTYTGTTTVSGGTLRTVGTNLLTSAGTSVAAGATLDVILPTSGTWTSPLTDPSALVLEGPGNLTFSTAQPNVNLTTLTVSGGTLVLDQSSDNGSKVGASAALVLGSGGVSLIGNSSAPSGQTFTSTTLSGGAQLSVTAGGSQNATISAGAIVRGNELGSTVNFNLINTSTGVASVTTTTAVNSTGTLGGYATVNGTDWAVSGTGTGPFNITALTPASYSSNSWASGAHTDVTSSFAASLNNSTGDVRFNTAVAAVVTLTGTNNISNGGILVTPNVGANISTIASTSNSGGGAIAALQLPKDQDLIIQQFNTAAPLTLTAQINNSAGTATTANTSAGIAATASDQVVSISSIKGTGIALGDVVTGFGITNGRVVAISGTSVTIGYSATPSANTSAGTLTFTPETNVVKSGPGQLILGNTLTTNKFTGQLILNQGVTTVGATGNLGGTAAGVYYNGGTLEFTQNYAGGSGIQQWIVGPAGGTIQVDPGAVVSKEGNTFWGSGNIAVTGGGTFDIGSNVSAFTGQINVANGVFRLTSNQVKNSTGITIASGSEYELDDTTSGPFNLAPGASLTLNGNGPNNNGAWLHILDEAGSADYAFNSQIILQSTSRFTEIERVDANGIGGYDTNTDIFPLAISGPGGLIKDGNGTLVLASPFNTYGGANGSTIISNGTLQLGALNGVPQANTLQFGETGSSNSGTFDLAGYNQTVAGLTTAGSGSAHQIINSNTSQSVLTVNYNGTSNQVFTGQIGGGTPGSQVNNNIAFVKTGTGTLSLLGTTTYTGGVTVAAGALRVTGNAVSRPYTVNDGATLIVTNTDGTPLPASTLTLGNTGVTDLDFEFNGATPTGGAIAVSGSNGLTLNGTVDVAVSSVSPLTVGQFPLITYSGAMQGGGFAAFNPTLVLPSRVMGQLVNDTANNSIDLDITGVDFLKWSGSVNNNWDINTTPNFNLNSNNAPTTYLDLPSPDSVVFDDSATGSRNVNLTTTLSPASVTVNNSNGDYTFGGPGLLAGTTGITKTGTGALNLLTNNTYTGTTTISAGTIVVGNGGTTGSLGTGNVIDNASLVFNRSDNVTFGGNITGSGSVTQLAASTLTLSGTLNVGSAQISAGTLVVEAGAINGGISGPGSLVKSGAGLLAVGGDVTNDGGVNISQGTFQIGNGGTSGTLSGNATVASGAFLGFGRTDTYTYSGAIAGAGGVMVNSGDVILNGNLTYTGNTQVGANTLEIASNTNTNFTGVLSGSGTLIKSGTGQLTLFNSNPFNGTVIVNNGIVELTDQGASGDLDATSIIINNGGRFIFGQGGIPGENPDFPDTTFITINTGGTFEIRVGEEYGGVSLQGGTYLANGAGVGSNLNATTGAPVLGFDLQSGTVAAINTSGGAATLTAANTNGGLNKSTTGTVNFTGLITYSSATPININQGTLSFQAQNVPTTGTAGVTIGSGQGAAVFQMIDTGSATLSRPVTLNSGGSIDLPSVGSAPGGTLTLAGSVSGGDLNLTGTGTLILSGSDGYGGNTNIAGGTLSLAATGSISNSQNIYVNPGTTFQLAGQTNSSAGILTRSLTNLNISSGGLAIASLSSVHGNRQVVVLNSLSMAGSTGAWTGKFDLGNNDLDIHNASLATVTSQVQQGYNQAGGGNWNGSGGISSTAAANDSTHLTALGVIENTVDGSTPLFGGSLGSFDGQYPSATDVLVKYTYYGDTNLDGQVDGTDYSRIDNGYLNQLTGWYNGDFNYDGVINGSDYTLIDNAYNMQGASLAAQVASATAQVAGGSSSVPEPASLGLLAAGAIGLLGRRRRA
jgi:fibronectin-binding autotransporter adhesin